MTWETKLRHRRMACLLQCTDTINSSLRLTGSLINIYTKLSFSQNTLHLFSDCFLSSPISWKGWQEYVWNAVFFTTISSVQLLLSIQMYECLTTHMQYFCDTFKSSNTCMFVIIQLFGRYHHTVNLRVLKDKWHVLVNRHLNLLSPLKFSAYVGPCTSEPINKLA